MANYQNRRRQGLLSVRREEIQIILVTRLLGYKLRLSNDNNLVLRESRILLAGADDLANISRVAIVQRQVKVPLVFGQSCVDNQLLQAVDIIWLFALQDVDIPELTALDFLIQCGKGYRFTFYCHICFLRFSVNETCKSR